MPQLSLEEIRKLKDEGKLLPPKGVFNKEVFLKEGSSFLRFVVTSPIAMVVAILVLLWASLWSSLSYNMVMPQLFGLPILSVWEMLTVFLVLTFFKMRLPSVGDLAIELTEEERFLAQCKLNFQFLKSFLVMQPLTTLAIYICVSFK